MRLSEQDRGSGHASRGQVCEEASAPAWLGSSSCARGGRALQALADGSTCLNILRHVCIIKTGDHQSAVRFPSLSWHNSGPKLANYLSVPLTRLPLTNLRPRSNRMLPAYRGPRGPAATEPASSEPYSRHGQRGEGTDHSVCAHRVRLSNRSTRSNRH